MLLFACTPEENNSDDDKEVVATAIKLNKNELTLEKGANEILSVSFTPSNVTNQAVTWVSSNKDIAEVTDGNVIAVGAGNTEITVKQGDLTDKCAVMVVISAKSITLNKDSIELEVGCSEEITATVWPSNTTDKVEWSSSAEGVAIVEDGVVTAIAPGVAPITARAGFQTAICKVVVKEPFKIGPVDLGLSVKWANANLGADSEEAYGDYYAWGEVETKEDFSLSTYKWWDGSYLIKYNTRSSNGTVDNKTILDPEDDAAHVILGGCWRMPTYAEWIELIDNCSIEWTTENAVVGMRVISRTNGNSIFLPAAGLRSGTNFIYVGINGYYWSSSLNNNNPPYAWYLNLNGGNPGMSNGGGRASGHSIRPVI